MEEENTAGAAGMRGVSTKRRHISAMSRESDGGGTEVRPWGLLPASGQRL
jgi:hypothetical protein